MSLVVANAGRAALAALLLFTAASLRRDELSRERAVALVVEAEDVDSICRKAGCRPETFLARLRALGVAGLALRPEPLSRLLQERDVVRFTEEEVSRLKATGIAVPGAPLSPGALFVKDDAGLRRLEAAARAQGVTLEKARYGRMGVLTLPAGLGIESFSAGYAPRWVAAAAGAGLVPVYRVSSTSDLRLSLEAEGPAAVLLDAAESGLDTQARARLREAMAERRLWAASNVQGAAASFAADRLLAPAEVPSSIPLDAFLRLVAGRGPALVVIALDRDSGPEAVVGELRRLSRGLRKEGTAPSWPSGLFEARRPGSAERTLRLLLSFAAAVILPLLAMRQGLAWVRRASRSAILPEASPVREGVFGLGAVAFWACAAGLVLRALSSGVGGGFGLPSWFIAASAVLAGAGFVALWLPDGDCWAALRRADKALVLRLAAAAAGAWLLLSPPAGLRAWALGLGPLAKAHPAWWWAPSRWAEVFIGYPALFIGLCRYAQALGALSGRRAETYDPKAWLFAGLAAPAGLAGAMMNSRIPLASALTHSSYCLAAGLLLGALAYVGLGFRGRNPSGS